MNVECNLNVAIRIGENVMNVFFCMLQVHQFDVQ